MHDAGIEEASGAELVKPTMIAETAREFAATALSFHEDILSPECPLGKLSTCDLCR